MLGFFALIAAVVALWPVAPGAALALDLSDLQPQQWLRSALAWVQTLGPWGAIAFIGLYGAATVALVPGSVLTLGAGVVFGILWGSIYVFVGATLGAIAGFLVGRHWARPWVAKKLQGYPQFEAIDRAVAREGFKIVLLTRLSPVFPFNLLNYALGITGVSLKSYAIASVGMIPGTVMYVYVGALAGNIALMGGEETAAVNSTAQWLMRIVGLGATLGVTVLITAIARKALQRELADPAPKTSPRP